MEGSNCSGWFTNLAGLLSGQEQAGESGCCIQIPDPCLLIVYPWVNDVTSLSLAFLNYKMGKMVIKIRSSEVQGGTNYVTHA